MTPAQLRQWRAQMSISQRAAAQLFGVALTTYQSWEMGKNLGTGAPLEISRTVDLACGALAAGVAPYSETCREQ